MSVWLPLRRSLLTWPLLAACLLTSPVAPAADKAVEAGLYSYVYPAHESVHDRRFDDLIEILRTALEKTRSEFGPYELRPSSYSMPESRYLNALASALDLSIIWSSTSQQMESSLRPVRIPLRRGLLGYRIALIEKGQQGRIDQIQSAEDLKKFNIGQGLGWGDVQIYQAAGITVTTAKYPNLFAMTANKRFDLFPRGISEVFKEYELNKAANPGLAIEKNLLLYYPWPYYFFFNKEDEVLAYRVEVGLRKMLKDGSFLAIFHKYNADAIKRANLQGRRIIRLPNPLLPKETPLSDNSLWFDPAHP